MAMLLAESTGPNSALGLVLAMLVAGVVVGLVLAKSRSSVPAASAATAQSASSWIVMLAPPAFVLALLAIGVNVKRHSDAGRLEARIARLESTVAHAEAEMVAADDAKLAIARASDQPLIAKLPVVEHAPTNAEEIPPEKGGRIVVESASWHPAKPGTASWEVSWEAVARNVGDTPGRRALHVELLDQHGFLGPEGLGLLNGSPIELFIGRHGITLVLI